MYELYLEVKLKTPLLITAEKVGESFRSLDYIPGSTLRGTLASLFLAEGIKPSSDDFKNIFINGEVRFGNLYYKYTEKEKVDYPLPLSWHYCKAEKSHSFGDYLTQPVSDECPVCQSRMVNKPVSLGIKKEISMHTAIDFKTQTAEENKLFSYELISEGQSFSGKIKSPRQDLLVKIKDILEKNKEGIYLGKGVSRGLGEVKILKKDISEPKVSVSELRDGFTVTLLSEAILMNEDGTFNRILTGKDLEIGDLIPEKAFGKTREITLWNSAADLPRETVLALVAGSCFYFKPDKLVQIKTLLEKAEEEGIGIRREQGFGEIKINDERHNNPQIPSFPEEKSREKSKNEIEKFETACIKVFEEDKEKLSSVNKPSALFALVSFANNKDFGEVSKELEEQTGRDKSIFKKVEIKGKPFGDYIKEKILDKANNDINKARAGLLALCRVIQAYRKEE